MYYVTTWVNGAQVLTGPFTLIKAKKEFEASAKSALKTKIVMLLKLREITNGELMVLAYSLQREPQRGAIISRPAHFDTYQLTGTSLESFVKFEMQSIAEVQAVTTRVGRGHLHVEIVMSDFSRAARERVYAKQQAFYSDFADHAFTFDMIDKSPVNGVTE